MMTALLIVLDIVVMFNTALLLMLIRDKPEREIHPAAIEAVKAIVPETAKPNTVKTVKPIAYRRQWSEDTPAKDND